MSKKHLAIFVVAILIVFGLNAATALASPRVMPKLPTLAVGHRRTVTLVGDNTVVSESWKVPLPLAYSIAQFASASSGGTPCRSGSAVLWTRTDCYNWAGDHIFAYTTRLYWSWAAGRVVLCHWQAPSYQLYNTGILSVQYNGTSWIPGGFRYAYGSSYGCYYAGANGSFVGTIGMFAPRWDVFHNNWVYSNGTWAIWGYINRSGLGA